MIICFKSLCIYFIHISAWCLGASAYVEVIQLSARFASPKGTMIEAESRDAGWHKDPAPLAHRPGTHGTFQNQPLACPGKGSEATLSRSVSVLHTRVHTQKHTCT